MVCIPGVSQNCNPLGDAVKQGATAMLDEIAKQAASALTEVVKTLFTGWLGGVRIF
jgi:hypothetical protein